MSINRYKHGEWREGQPVRAHVLIAERVLGHRLPPKAQVHHVNEDRADNRNCNLVICEDSAYHHLLHQRTRALEACGHADWRKCGYCHEYDAPSSLVIRWDYARARQQTPYHRSCRARYEYTRKWRKQGRTVISALRTA